MPKLINDRAYVSAVPLTRPRKAAGADNSFIYNPPAAPSGLTGSIGGGGGGSTMTRTVTPLQVYQDQILADPGAVSAQGMFEGQTSNLALARRDAIQQALIRSGWTPQLTGALEGYAGDITPSALSQAAANPMSQKAQLDLQLAQEKGNTPYDLAASGAGRSGALAIQLGNLSRQYDTASYQGAQDLLGAITGAVNTYAGGYNQALGGLEAARREIADRLARQAGYSESIVTTPDDSWAPSPSQDQLSPSYPAPVVNQAVQRAISDMGFRAGSRVPGNLYQTIRQTYLGG